MFCRGFSCFVLAVCTALLGCSERSPDSSQPAVTEQGVEQFTLARKYELGDGVARDESRALDLYEKALKSGVKGAAVNIAAMYYDGRGAPQSFEKAAAMYDLALQSGLTGAAITLGHMYLEGQGVTKDEEKGFSLLLNAAKKGDRYAPNSLAMLFATGRGTKADQIQALAWALAGVSRGDGNAKATVEGLSRKLNEEETQRAKKLAADFAHTQ